ncbi:MAG: hypothetical protein ABIT01_14175 [Thermoanaerobaculia bacterium]
MKRRLVLFLLAVLCSAQRLFAQAAGNSFFEPFAWSGGHASTIRNGESTTVWWNPDAWDARVDTSYLSVSAGFSGHHVDIHKALSADPTDAREDNTKFVVGGNGSPGLAAMRTDYHGISSARLRNPMLLSPTRPGVVTFYASRFLTSGHWWEIAITPTAIVGGGEQTAVPSTVDGLEGPAAEPPGGGTPGPGHRPALDSINVIASGYPDIPCDTGWFVRFAVTRSLGGVTTDVYNPVTDISQLLTTHPEEIEQLYLWRVEFRPGRIDLMADLDRNGMPELIESFAVNIPWSEVYVHFLAVTYQADHHPQAPCFLGSVREFVWRDISVAPVKYARTHAHPKELGTANVPRDTGWLSFDLRDTQRFGPAINGIPQANPVAFDGWMSLLACNVAAFYCPNPASALHRNVDIPVQSLYGLKRVQLVYDIRSVFPAGVASLTINGHPVGVMPGHATVPGAGDSEWAHRSIDLDGSFLQAGANSVDIAMTSDVELDRLQLELDADTPPAPAVVASGFFPLAPCRVIDTRGAAGSLGGPMLIGGGTPRLFTVAGTCGIPASARTISANVTVVNPEGSGNMRLFPGDSPAPGANAISFRSGRVRANNALLLLAADGSGSLAIQNDSPGASHVILDVNGYFK